MLTDTDMLAIATAVSRGFELAGVSVIVVGSLLAVWNIVAGAAFGRGAEKPDEGSDLVAAFRKTLGRSILTGLELLVAADIIRTFLSFSLEVEINGKWPWQTGKSE